MRAMHISHGYGKNWRISEWDCLHRMMRGIKRVKGDKPGDARLPVTALLLARFHTCLLKPLRYDTLVVLAAMCMATYGLLRSGEFATCSRNRDPLKVEQAKLRKDYMTVSLKQSKTDPFRQGVIIHIGETGTQTCPVKLVRSMLAERASRNGGKRPHPLEPLFQLSNGKALDRKLLVLTLKKWCTTLGIESSRYNGHSFRIGGATSLAAAGVPDSIIQTLGRWKSDCFKIYIRLDKHDLHGYSKRMASHKA